MQQSMVRMRPIIGMPPERRTTVPMRVMPRPVTLMQPEMMPATAQATATVMEPRAPAARASMNLRGVMRVSLLKRLATMATTMLIAAENWMVLVLVLTMTTSTTMGASR